MGNSVLIETGLQTFFDFSLMWCDKVPVAVSDVMLLTAVFNSCINPVIYGAHYLPDIRTLGRGKEDRWVAQLSF